MKRIFAIAGLTLRSAIRSRVLLVLLGLLLLVVVGLPLSIKGDGTLGGRVQILLSYTLGFAGVLVAIATVWAACAAVSTEVQQRQIQLVMTKPVHPIELWLGKWFGLLLLAALLLGFAGAVVYGLLRWTTRATTLQGTERALLRDEILVARAAVAPQTPELDRRARERLERERAAGTLPANTPVEEAFRAIRRDLVLQSLTVEAGTRRVWTFALPFEPDPARDVFLQFRFVKSKLDVESIAGFWTVGAPGAAAPAELSGGYRPDAVQSLRIPGAAAAGARTMTVAFENRDPRGATVLFDPDQGLQLLLYRGTFAGNYVRTLLAMFFQMAFLAAVGLSLGSLLSMPVASFVSVGFVFVIRLSSYVDRMAREESFFFDRSEKSFGAVLVEKFFHGFFTVLHAVMTPLEGPDTLDWLASGRLVSAAAVGRVFLADVVVYGGLLALLCAWLFRRRELGSAP